MGVSAAAAASLAPPPSNAPHDRTWNCIELAVPSRPLLICFQQAGGRWRGCWDWRRWRAAAFDSQSCSCGTRCWAGRRWRSWCPATTPAPPCRSYSSCSPPRTSLVRFLRAHSCDLETRFRCLLHLQLSVIHDLCVLSGCCTRLHPAALEVCTAALFDESETAQLCAPLRDPRQSCCDAVAGSIRFSSVH